MKDTEKKKTPAKTAKKAVAQKVKAPVVAEKKEEVKACCCKKNLVDAYVDVLASYAKFNGRLSRRGYWGFVLFNFIFTMICLFLDAFLLTKGVLFLTYGLLTIVPSYAAVARRLHDINRSMWWEMIPLLIVPLILQIAAYYNTELLGLWKYMGVVYLVITYVALIMCYVLCYFLLKRGCDGANKYGEKPCC